MSFLAARALIMASSVEADLAPIELIGAVNGSVVTSIDSHGDTLTGDLLVAAFGGAAESSSGYDSPWNDRGGREVDAANRLGDFIAVSNAPTGLDLAGSGNRHGQAYTFRNASLTELKGTGGGADGTTITFPAASGFDEGDCLLCWGIKTGAAIGGINTSGMPAGFATAYHSTGQRSFGLLYGPVGPGFSFAGGTVTYGADGEWSCLLARIRRQA